MIQEKGTDHVLLRLSRLNAGQMYDVRSLCVDSRMAPRIGEDRKSGAAERVVVEAEGLHCFCVVEVSAVDDQTTAHVLAGLFPI